MCIGIEKGRGGTEEVRTWLAGVIVLDVEGDCKLQLLEFGVCTTPEGPCRLSDDDDARPLNDILHYSSVTSYISFVFIFSFIFPSIYTYMNSFGRLIESLGGLSRAAGLASSSWQADYYIAGRAAWELRTREQSSKASGARGAKV